MKEWRILIDTPRIGSLNMAIDYAVMEAVAESYVPPTLRLYQWSKSTVTIGFFQVVEQETDFEACVRDDIGVIRRITGGGAVFHDNEITYSIAIPLDNALSKGTIVDSYEKICRPVVMTLQNYGIDAEFRPVNDILVKGKKISGSAQTRRNGVLLQHGTILLKVDTSKMFKYLKVSKEKLSDKIIKEPVSGITSVSDEAEMNAMNDGFIKEFNGTIIDNYRKTYEINFSKDKLSAREMERALIIEKKIFADNKWNMDRRKIRV